MSDQNTFNGYSTDADKCPNCGVMKIFSALVCPSCGMSYSDAAAVRKTADEKPKYSFASAGADTTEPEAKPTITSFDPNASFASFKKQVSGEVEEAAGVVEETVEKVVEPEPPVSQDQAPVNSGLYGERKYRVGDDLSKAPIMGISDKRPEGEPDQTVVPTRYGLDNESVKNKREQSLTNEAAKQKMFSTTVNNHYEQYKSDRDGGYQQPSYATPYNRGSFDAEPEKKKSVLAKIFPLALVLILVLLVGYFVMKYMNRNKNDNGVEYTKGSVVDGYYVNDWAEVKVKLDSRLHYGSQEMLTVNLMNSMFKAAGEKMDMDIDINMMASYNNNVAILIMTCTDTSFPANIFGSSEDSILEGNKVGSITSSGTGSYLREPDLALGSHTYKAASGDFTSSDGTKGKMLVAARKIGFKVIVIAFYEIPGATDLTTLKKYFENY